MDHEPLVRDSKTQNVIARARDILVWSDNFWCFREELDPRFGRDPYFRVVLSGTEEWLRVTAEADSLL